MRPDLLRRFPVHGDAAGRAVHLCGAELSAVRPVFLPAAEDCPGRAADAAAAKYWPGGLRCLLGGTGQPGNRRHGVLYDDGSCDLEKNEDQRPGGNEE